MRRKNKRKHTRLKPTSYTVPVFKVLVEVEGAFPLSTLVREAHAGLSYLGLSETPGVPPGFVTTAPHSGGGRRPNQACLSGHRVVQVRVRVRVIGLGSGREGREPMDAGPFWACVWCGQPGCPTLTLDPEPEPWP